MAAKPIICSICATARPSSAFFASEIETRRCKVCLRISRQKTINNSYKKFLKRAEQQLKSHRVKQGFDWTLTGDQLIDIWDKQSGKCAVSGLNMTHHRGAHGRKMPLNASIDRINNSEHYIAGNVQLVCYQVNIMRHTLDVGEFEWWIRTIYEHQTRDL
jgi:hypothetical protein